MAERLRLARLLKPQTLAPDGETAQRLPWGSRVEWRHAFTVFAAGAASGRSFVLSPEMTPSGSSRRDRPT